MEGILGDQTVIKYCDKIICLAEDLFSKKGYLFIILCSNKVINNMVLLV